MTQTREEWLHELTEHYRPIFEGLGAPLPARENLHIGCSFMSGGSRSTHIGECISKGDGTQHIVISPKLVDEIDVGATLVHELIHAALPNDGHKAPFQRVAKALGLRAPRTATTPGPEITEQLTVMISTIGHYPHKQLDFKPRAQRTIRHKNLNCPDCGFHAKVWEHQLSMGRLVCPAGCVDSNDEPQQLLLREEML